MTSEGQGCLPQDGEPIDGRDRATEGPLNHDYDDMRTYRLPVRAEDNLVGHVRRRREVDRRSEHAVDIDLRASAARSLCCDPRHVATGERELRPGTRRDRRVERAAERSRFTFDRPARA